MHILKSSLALVAFLSAVTASAGALRGAILIAADGTFLGTCDGKYGMYSIANEYGQYGSKYNSQSIFNQYGQYGSAYGTYSAFNKVTSQAPYILGADPELLQLVTNVRYRPTPAIISALRSSGANRVSANSALLGAIDPNVIRVACENP